MLERIARGEKRALLSLATGAGKTFIAVHLLKRIADAGQLRRALFLCDRDELRSQGLGAFQNVFGADAAEVFEEADGSNHARNARIHIATYQTLDVASDEADANFLLKHYPANYFSHIIIDECHRSAWGKWSQVFHRNPNAVQIGLTATPRQIKITERSKEAQADAQVNRDNLKHFGDPVYEYDMSQGIEDGYLAACEIVRRDIFLDEKAKSERETGVERQDLQGKLIADAITGEILSETETREHYDASSFEARLLLPERVAQMCRDLFEQLIATGGPEQKTIIFCASDNHADRVAIEMNNLYADWCKAKDKAEKDFVGCCASAPYDHDETHEHRRARIPIPPSSAHTAKAERDFSPYAFKCTAASSGNDALPDLRGASRHHFIATTVDLLTTGVDVPCVRNVVFFKYVRSPIAFYQMGGRGTRLDPTTGKLMFRVYDYTNATRLFGEEFLARAVSPRKPKEEGTEPPPEHPLVVEGFDVRVTDAGRYIVTTVDGKAMPVTVEEYKQQLAARLVEEAPTLDDFRARWIAPAERRALLGRLPDAGRSAQLIRSLEEMNDYDLYDVLAELGYGLAPRTRIERAETFAYKHADWLNALPAHAAATLRALTHQFARAGTDGLENPQVFQMSEVVAAGGLNALRALGKPADVLRETKERMFAA